jgi:hypothetical protein
VPSMKHSSHRTRCRSSNWARNARHRFSSTPVYAHSHNRRCTVLLLPYRGGSAHHGDPVHRIHRIPSKHRRASAGGRPRPRFRGAGGKWGLIASHCRSVTLCHAIVPPFGMAHTQHQPINPRKGFLG